MSAAPFLSSPLDKRPKLYGCAAWFVRILRMFWLTGLVLLLVALYGLYAGWSTQRQWGDALFYAAVAQIMMAALPAMGASAEFDAASEVRYLPKGDVSEIRGQLAEVAMSKVTFSMRMFLGAVVTLLISALVTWI